MDWKDINIEPPPKGIDFLVCTEDNTMRVVRWTGKAFNTYLKVLFWCDLPTPPKPTTNEELPAPKKRGRKKKE